MHVSESTELVMRRQDSAHILTVVIEEKPLPFITKLRPPPIVPIVFEMDVIVRLYVNVLSLFELPTLFTFNTT